MTEVTNKTVGCSACDYCHVALATHCIGVAELENTCQDCLSKMSECAEQGHVFQNSRIMYSRVTAYKWLCCSRCWYDDLEPLYGVRSPRSWYKDLEIMHIGTNYLPVAPDDIF